MLREVNKMATIKELYFKAGNPDLTHWKDIHLFSIAEAALLTAGIDPLLYEDRNYNESVTTILKAEKPQNWQHGLMIIRALKQSICLGEITCKVAFIDESNWVGEEWVEKIEQLDLTLEHLEAINMLLTKISRKEYKKWLKNNGYLESPQQTETILSNAIFQPPQPINYNDALLIPQTTYTTPALEAIHGVVNHWWKDFNPDDNQSLPQQKLIKSWIADNYPEMDTDYMQTAIDKICRHPSAKKGGNRKLMP